jgi:hypothetical protein
LGIWLANLVIHQFKPEWINRKNLGTAALCCAGLTLAHVAYHHPGSYSGLWGVALAAIFAAWQPLTARAWETAGDQPGNALPDRESFPALSMVHPIGLEQVIAALLPWVPTWLVFFSQAPQLGSRFEIPIMTGPVLATLATFFLTGCLARVYQLRLAPVFKRWPRSQFRLFDLSLSWFETAGGGIHLFALWISFGAAVAIQVLHYDRAFGLGDLILLTSLEAGLAVAWYYQGKLGESMAPYYLLQLSVVAFFAAIRRHLMLTTSFWNYEYDVWASLAASFLLAGAKQVFDLRPRKQRVPIVSAIFILPVVALIWVLVHQLGANIALLVVGLQSLMFAYLGKDERESPFNIVAIAGFVAFVILTFWTKLHLTAIHAYIIPTGLGILVMLQLFRERVTPPTRNGVRLVVLLSMLGSSAYYALADTRYSIAFNVTLILLSLLAMGVGSFLRVLLYLVLGFLGLTVDLASLLYKVLFHMERSSRMTAVGSLVLVIGAAVIFGAIYYKTNKEKLDARLNYWRAKLGEWE